MALLLTADPLYTYFSMAYFRVDTQDIPATIEYITDIIRRMDPAHAEMTGLRFFDEFLGDLYLKEQHTADLITLFSLLAVLISVMGVFGLVLFEAQYRRKEIALRRINGATVPQILWIFNRRFVRIVVVCFVIALPAGLYFIHRWLEQFAYKSPVHWWIFAVAFGAVLLLTVLTVTLQSFRAATDNPVHSIKSE